MELVIEARPYDDADVVRMVAEVQAIYVEMYGAPDEAVITAEEFVAPLGVLFVGVLDGGAVAMGGWRRRSDGSAEIKRMYVSPTAQRRGVGRAMLHAAETSAREAGVERLVLNTGPHQRAAIALYEAEGYTPSEPFGFYAGHGDALFMAKSFADDEARLA